MIDNSKYFTKQVEIFHKFSTTQTSGWISRNLSSTIQMRIYYTACNVVVNGVEHRNCVSVLYSILFMHSIIVFPVLKIDFHFDKTIITSLKYRINFQF